MNERFFALLPWLFSIIAATAPVCAGAETEPTSLSTDALVTQAPVGGDAWAWNRSRSSKHDGRIGTPNDPVLAELWRRMGDRTLTAEQYQVYVDRFLEANPDQWWGLLRTRDVWPERTPIEVRVWPVWFLNAWKDVIVRLRLHGVPDSEWHERHNFVWEGNRNMRGPAKLGTPEAGAAECRFDVQILICPNVKYDASGTYVDDLDVASAQQVWSGTSPPVSVKGTPAEVMQPIGGQDLDDKIRRLNPELHAGAEGELQLCLHRKSTHIDASRGDWALGVTCEVFDGDEVLASGSALYGMVPPPLISEFEFTHVCFDLESRIPAAELFKREGLRVRLTGDAAVAVRDLARTLYWGGEIDVPAVWRAKARTRD